MGAGKSTASQAFEALGIEVVDADQLAHAVTGPGGRAMPDIAAQFGPSVVQADGGLNRNAMRALAFGEVTARQRLEAIVHPLVGEAAQQALQGATSPYVIYAVPLWFEKHGRARPDWVWRVVVVDLPEAIQRARVQARSALPEDQLTAMLARQARREDRLSIADHVLINASDPGALKSQVEALHRTLLTALDQPESPG